MVSKYESVKNYVLYQIQTHLVKTVIMHSYRQLEYTYCLFHIQLTASVLWAATAFLTTSRNFG